MLLSKVAGRCCFQQKLLNTGLRSSLVRTNLPSHVARIGSKNEPRVVQLPHLIRPLFFTVGICGASMIGAQIWRYERISKEKRMTARELQAYWQKRRQELLKKDGLMSTIRFQWERFSKADKAFFGLFALNAIVFAAWKSKSLRPFMLRNFVTNCEPGRVRLMPMILSNFSHNNFFHFGLNMLVLSSFFRITSNSIGLENTLALYMSAGVTSSFTSYFYKAVVGGITPSLGASGCILGILAAACVEKPDIELMVIFFPFYSFSSMTALKGILAFDLLGCILRFGFFDHAAHLGGTLLGILFSTKLKHTLMEMQPTIIKNWLEVKSKFV